jgi:hypothetical protein
MASLPIIAVINPSNIGSSSFLEALYYSVNPEKRSLTPCDRLRCQKTVTAISPFETEVLKSNLGWLTVHEMVGNRIDLPIM